MKRNKQIMGLTLAATMVLVTACGSGKTADNGSSSASASSKASPAASASGETYQIVMGYPMLGNVPKDIGDVEAAISKITKEKINATVKLMAIPFGQWNQQQNLMLASNEKLDLMLLDFASYNSFVAKKQIMDLSGLLDKYGKGIKDALGTNLDVAKINGKVYATPTAKFTESGTAIVMRKDTVEKLGLDLSKVKTTDDLNAVFQTVKDKMPDMSPLAPSNNPSGMSMTSLIDALSYDNLSDGLGVLMSKESGLKVVDLYETPDYKAALQKMRGWYEAGYLPKDAATTKTLPNDMVKSGKAFATITTDGPSAEDKETASNGTPMVKVSLQKPVLTTMNVLGLLWGIPVNNSKNPDKAMEFLNLTYTDKDIVNLINFGVEGKHYTKKSDNVIVPTAGDNGYVVRQSFMFGNTKLTYLLDGESSKARDEGKAFEDSMIKSKALGFIPDLEPVKTEVAAVNNVINQYKVALETGSVDPDKILPQFIEKLKAAGMDKIIAEKQKQLDAWAASKK